MDVNHQRSQTNRTLNICLIGSTYPRYHEDSGVPWLRETVRRLSERGHQITVLAPSYKGLASHEIDGTKVIRFRYAPKRLESLTHDQGAPNRIRNKAYELLAIPYIINGSLALASLLRKQKFDLINVHWPFPHGLFTWLVKPSRRPPVVSTCHGAELALAQKKPWVARLLRRILLSSDQITCNSSHTAERIRQLCGRKASIVPYGATVRDKSEQRRQNQTPTILFTGRHIQRKGVDYLIRAMPLIQKEMNAQLLITGDGDRRREWENLAVEQGVAESVKFLGYVSNEELANLYNSCDVYVLPAIHDDKGDTEGLGVVLIEALMYKNAVVASDVGGIRDIIKHEHTGLLVKEKNIFLLAEAIIHVIKNTLYAKKLGQNGFSHVKSNFNWKKIIDDLEKIYKSIL